MAVPERQPDGVHPAFNRLAIHKDTEIDPTRYCVFPDLDGNPRPCVFGEQMDNLKSVISKDDIPILVAIKAVLNAVRLKGSCQEGMREVGTTEISRSCANSHVATMRQILRGAGGPLEWPRNYLNLGIEYTKRTQ